MGAEGSLPGTGVGHRAVVDGQDARAGAAGTGQGQRATAHFGDVEVGQRRSAVGIELACERRAGTVQADRQSRGSTIVGDDTCTGELADRFTESVDVQGGTSGHGEGGEVRDHVRGAQEQSAFAQGSRSRIAVAGGGQTQAARTEFDDAAGTTALQGGGDFEADRRQTRGGDVARRATQIDVACRGCCCRAGCGRGGNGRRRAEAVIDGHNVSTQRQNAVGSTRRQSRIGVAAGVVERQRAVECVAAGVSQRASSIDGDVRCRGDLT